MHLMDAYLAGVCLMGVHLVGVQVMRVSRRHIMHLTQRAFHKNVCLTGIHPTRHASQGVI
jgi:hypothetical protein